MTTAQFSRFFATMSLACWAAVIGMVVVMVVARWRPASAAGAVLDSIRPIALWLGWMVAAVTMAGSLYYSLGAHFEPCELCWYQRICEYPLAVLLLVAAVRHDTNVRRYALPLAAIGAVIAAYHTQLQAFPDQRSFCTQFNPCTIRYVWEFGFVSLPLMDLAALLFVATMVLVARNRELDPDDDQPEPEDAR